VIDAVLFDLDGTLADTAPDMARTVNLMRTNRGLAPVAAEVVRPHVSQGARGMITSAFGIGTDHADFTAMRAEFLDLYAGNLCIDTRLFPGMEELLARLDGEAIAWGVVTNKFERFAKPLIEALGLAGRAAVVIGGDTCARAKPFPDPLLYAASALGVDPALTLYVGDDERDVQAARAAGMPVVVAGYGYLGGSAPATWGADAILDSPAHLDAWIRDAGGRRAAQAVR
jgi:2-phosphoglycolate phosphatase